MKLNDNFLTKVSEFLTSSQILLDSESRNTYGQDWSNVYKPKCSVVLLPKTTEEVSKILKFASEYSQMIVPSGGRTGLSGGAVAIQDEVVLSLDQLNYIGPIDEGALTLKVGAGAITEAVHEFCEPFGLTWPVDFASKGSSQVGGNISTNAGGVRVIKYGSTRNWVLGLTAVTMDGTIHSFNGELEKNNTGLDFRQLLIGSEGTLAVITEAILKLAPLPESNLVFFFSLKDFTAVINLFSYARKNVSNLSAFECMDQKCYQVSTAHLGIAPPVQSDSGAYVLMEFQNETFENAEKWLTEIFEKELVQNGVMAKSKKEADDLWKIREGVAESIMAGHQVHQEDVSVPLASLEQFYSDIQARYSKEYSNLAVFFFGHIGDGNLHIFIRKPATQSTEDFLKTAHESDLKLFEILSRYQGSVSAEHGIGLLKKHALHFTRSPAEIALSQRIKQTFDPENLLNPGKIQG